MILLADENMPMVAELFAGLVSEIRYAKGREITREQLEGVDVLLVRSVTKVNQSLLKHSHVRFVGSATIGVDHIDREYLQSRNIKFCNSPGANADSVVDYDLAAMVSYCNDRNLELDQLTVGIIGVGNVGGRLAKRLQAAGIETVLNDPPKALAGGDGFSSLEQAMACDIVCVHTPLTHEGYFPTYRLINQSNIDAFNPNGLIISAGRGGVIEEKALAGFIDKNNLVLACDVWEGEPEIDIALLQKSYVGTPHIAGYSIEGKSRGTWMLYQEFCRWLGQVPEKSFEQQTPMVNQLALDYGDSLMQALTKAVSAVYDIHSDNNRAKEALFDAEDKNRAPVFDQLRKEYPERREFSSCLISQGSESQLSWLKALGFKVNAG